MFAYLIGGQRWRSAIALPDLTPLEGGRSVQAEVVIECGEVPPLLEEADYRARHLQVRRRDGAVLVLPPFGPRYLITQGRIVIEAADACGLALAEVALTIVAFGILCHQRKLLPLRANAVAVGDSAVLIAGASGTGKSTLAASLALEGFAPIADEVAPVGLDDEGAPAVIPGVERLRLWPESLAGLGLGNSALLSSEVGGGVWDSGLSPGQEPRRIAAIYILLNRHRAEPELTPLGGTRKIGVVAEATYRPQFQRLLGGLAAGFRLQAALAGSVPIYYFDTPRLFPRLADARQVLRRNWRALGIL